LVLLMLGMVASGLLISAQSPRDGTSAQELANQANNPAAPITLIQFRNILLPDIAGADGAANTLQLQPVVPIGPFKSVPLVQLMKLTIPLVVTLPEPVGQTGFGD